MVVVEGRQVEVEAVAGALGKWSKASDLLKGVRLRFNVVSY